ncbi:MAG: GNAT family N-acetyltransferase, partial [Anaerolineales bacterium]|nr:GNAT family N-acetyltransferase [Anaerolineales bacterium]
SAQTLLQTRFYRQESTLPNDCDGANSKNYVYGTLSHILGKKKMLDYWCGSDKKTYVAEIDGDIVGTFIIKDNFPDLGSHVANASYMTKPNVFGQGIGRAMAEFSLDEAKRLGYKAMQFNMVVKSNQIAVSLWQKLGFEIKAEIPEAFNHKEQGYTNAYIMWKSL